MLDFIVQMWTDQGHRQGNSGQIVVYESEPSMSLKHFTQIKHRGNFYSRQTMTEMLFANNLISRIIT